MKTCTGLLATLLCVSAGAQSVTGWSGSSAVDSSGSSAQPITAPGFTLPQEMQALKFVGAPGNGPWRVLSAAAEAPNADDQVFALQYNILPARTGAGSGCDVAGLGGISIQVESHYGYNDVPGHPTVSPNAEVNWDFYRTSDCGWSGRALAFLRSWSTGASSWKFGTSNDVWGLQLDGSLALFAPPLKAPGMLLNWGGNVGPMSASSPALWLEEGGGMKVGLDNPSASVAYARINTVLGAGQTVGTKISHSLAATPTTWVDDLITDDTTGAVLVPTGLYLGAYHAAPTDYLNVVSGTTGKGITAGYNGATGDSVRAYMDASGNGVVSVSGTGKSLTLSAGASTGVVVIGASSKLKVSNIGLGTHDPGTNTVEMYGAIKQYDGGDYAGNGTLGVPYGTANYTMTSTGAITLTAPTGVTITPEALGTCGDATHTEGTFVMVAGATTTPTKMCVCTYTPTGTVYAWVNALKNSAGTGVGNTTTCP